MKLNVHGGHNKKVTGASSILDEVTEDRKVKDYVIKYLKAQGHTVYDTTDDAGTTQSANLNNIVANCNKHSVDLDVSIHFNAGNSDKKGDGKTKGVEVLVYSTSSKANSYAKNVCAEVAKLGFTNRGVKVRTDLAVLRRTNSPAMLVECCFVDDKDDCDLYDADKMSQAIVKGITGKAVSSSSSSSSSSTSSTSSTTSTASSNSSFKSYTVKVSGVSKGDVLNIREKADASSKKTGSLAYNDPNKYTIVEESKNGSTTWGKLKSGKGWINLKYTKKA